MTTLVSFSYSGGYHPWAGLILGNDGNFYGTTYEGGSPGGTGYGTVFQLTTDNVLTHLVAFNLGNGANPLAGLTQGNDGGFYGTTSGGGSNGKGTIFRVTTNGALITLVSFDGDNGAAPKASLTLGSNNIFYGTTSGGGSNGQGTIFNVTTNGTLTTLVSFGGTNGASPLGGLTIGTDGNLYGTASQGGSDGKGVVFRLELPQNVAVTAQKVETGIQLQFTGTPAYPYILQSATNLIPPINWISFLTNAADSSGNWKFVDTNVIDISKFYRAVVP